MKLIYEEKDILHSPSESVDNYFLVLFITGAAGWAMHILYVCFNIRKQADFNVWVSSSRLKIIVIFRRDDS